MSEMLTAEELAEYRHDHSEHGDCPIARLIAHIDAQDRQLAQTRAAQSELLAMAERSHAPFSLRGEKFCDICFEELDNGTSHSLAWPCPTLLRARQLAATTPGQKEQEQINNRWSVCCFCEGEGTKRGETCSACEGAGGNWQRQFAPGVIEKCPECHSRFAVGGEIVGGTLQGGRLIHGPKCSAAGEGDEGGIEFIQCDDCGNFQADMGRNVACEQCGALMPESTAPGREKSVYCDECARLSPIGLVGPHDGHLDGCSRATAPGKKEQG